MKLNIYILNQRLNVSTKLLFVIAASILMLSACNHKSDKEITISGKIDGYSEKELVLELIMPSYVDTIQVFSTDKNGDFEIGIDSAANGFYRIVLNNENIIYLSLKDGDNIEILADYPNISRNYSVSGSKDCDLLKEMNARLIQSSDKLNDLQNKIKSASLDGYYNMDSLWNETNIVARNLYETDKDFLIDFININPESPVIFMALYQYIGISPILMIDQDMDIFELVLQNLRTNNPQMPHIAYLESEISKQESLSIHENREYINLDIGTKAPDFTIQDANGNNIALSDFLGSEVLIYFWSSWSEPSVKNLTEIINLKKSDGNLEIILFCLETNKDKWEASIEINKIAHLINVCDFKSWESIITKIYSIKSIPSFVLIDKNGEILTLTKNISDITEQI